MQSKTIFITAIDTNAGKTIVTGLLARYYKKNGFSVITQKLAQTGCKGISEDIIKHREIMSEPLNAFDTNGLTCPYVFEYPASPHLAARLENREIDLCMISKATRSLEKEFDKVLLEGVGGLSVPINDHVNLIDYLQEKKYPVILVAHGKLGSINHTLLSLEILKIRDINLLGVVYNKFIAESEIILNDTAEVIKKTMTKDFSNAFFIEIPFMENWGDIDFPL